MTHEYSPGAAATQTSDRQRSLYQKLIVLICVLAGLSLLLSGPSGNSLLDSLEVLADPAGRLSIDEVQHARFSPLPGPVMTAGFTDSAHWVRIKVLAREDNQAVRLRIRPTFLDEIQLYEADPGNPGQWRKRLGGDRKRGATSERGINSVGFLVYPQAPASVYFLRMQTSSTSMLHVDAMPPADAARAEITFVLWNILYFAMLLWMIVWGMQDFAQYRQNVVGLFVLYQSANLLYAFCIMGYIAALEPDTWAGFADRLTSMAVFWVHISAVVFHRSLLRPYRPARWLVRSVDSLLCLTIVLPLLYFAGWPRQALQLNVLTGLVASLLIAVAPFTARREGTPRLRDVRTLYFLMGCTQLFFILPFLGLSGAVEWTLQSTLMQGFLSALLMFFILRRRSRLLREELEARRVQASQAELQLQHERTHAQSLGRFIDMLTHEIKTPLAVAVMNLGATGAAGPYMQRARRALDNINAIIERIRLSQLAEHHHLQPQMCLSNISELVYECVETAAAPSRINASVGYALEARTDAGLLLIVITNLIDNALKYAPADQPVELSLERQQQEQQPGLLLRISNPLGKTETPDAEQLFNKFYRGTSAHSQSGSGLGLYLSRNLAQLLGADLSYQPHAGTVEFRLWLPT